MRIADSGLTFDYILDCDFNILMYTRTHTRNRVPSYLTDSSPIGEHLSILARFDKFFDQVGWVISK